MAESGEDVVHPVDEADNRSSQSSPIDLQSLTSPKTVMHNSAELTERFIAEFHGKSTYSFSDKLQPIPTEEDKLLQAACTILFTVPRAIEHYIDREYKGGFLQAILDYKDQLKTKLRPEEWDSLSQLIVHHRIYLFYDQIIQDTILDNEVLDLLISRCILRKEDRAEIEHHPRQSDRNKCILDFLILRPEDSYSVLLEVLKESSTCSKDLIECMEGQLYSHHKVVSKSKVRSSITGFHSVRIQKNYHNLTQNLSNTECIIDSLISKGLLNPDDRSEIVSSGVQTKINRKLIDFIRSEQDYQFFLEALKEDPTNAKLVSDLESTALKAEELRSLQTGALLPSLTKSPGFQTMITLVYMVKAIQISKTEPKSHDTSLSADLYRLQSWYKKILKMTVLDSHQYQQFVQTVKEVHIGKIWENDDPVDITWNVGVQKQVRKVICYLKASAKDTVLPREHHGSGDTPLIRACYHDYTDMVQWMLTNDVDVNQSRNDSVTGLFMASQNGHSDTVKLLLERNPEIDLCNKNGCSPLCIASHNGHSDTVKLLLERNPKIDLCENDGCSPLYIASHNGHSDTVKLLLERNPEIDLCENDGCSPLYIATNRSSIVNTWLKVKVHINVFFNIVKSKLEDVV
ncbi:unnamed protein product [Mytilus edulis]|uniref:CARD domain-containing protein n=1 Tax=Mytilus edulis TaxID=6550 RepID=A0A8S3S0H6_MYTED|nr:unnamed protein product [Mytilus edulis]